MPSDSTSTKDPATCRADFTYSITPRTLTIKDSGKGKKFVADDPLPPKVKAFWFHEEPAIPPWRLESAEKRKEREFLEGAGTWTG